jgi:hypothetical protein
MKNDFFVLNCFVMCCIKRGGGDTLPRGLMAFSLLKTVIRCVGHHHLVIIVLSIIFLKAFQEIGGYLNLWSGTATDK